MSEEVVKLRAAIAQLQLTSDTDRNARAQAEEQVRAAEEQVRAARAQAEEQMPAARAHACV